MLKKFWKILVTFWKDVLYGPGNASADLSRIAVAVGVLISTAAVVWNMLLGLPIELGPTGLLGGLGALYIGAAAFIYAKDRAKAENTVAVAIKEEKK